MKRTHHFRTRMSQRGVNGEMAQLALSFGEIEGDKYILDRRGALRLLDETRQLERVVKKVIDKGGVTVIAEGENLITTYNCTSRRKLG